MIQLVIEIDDTTYKMIKDSTFFISGGRGSARTMEYNVFKAIYDGKQLAQEQKWIPVSERLPKVGSTVLIQFVDSDSPYGISMDDYGSCALSWRDGDLWITNDGEFKESEILAWMPLPEEYKAERSDKK